MARLAYCTGCGVIFPKMHLMINHRRTNRCGGRFLPTDEREQWDIIHIHTRDWIDGRNDAQYSVIREAYIKVFALRKARLREWWNERVSLPESR